MSLTFRRWHGYGMITTYIVNLFSNSVYLCQPKFGNIMSNSYHVIMSRSILLHLLTTINIHFLALQKLSSISFEI